MHNKALQRQTVKCGVTAMTIYGENQNFEYRRIFDV